MDKTTKTRIAILTCGVFYTFLVFGFTDNLKGPTLPALLDDLNLNYSLGGTILFGAYLGFLIATLLTGFLSDIAGKKAPLLVAGACLVLGILGFTSSSSAVLLTVTMVLLGLGLGSIELGANSIIVDLHTARKGLFLNLMAVFHGAGSMLAPLYAGRMLEAGSSWRVVYRWDLLAAVIILIIFLLVKYPAHQPLNPERLDLGKIWKTAFTGGMGWYYLAISVYVALEIGIAAWIVEFLQETRGQSVSASTMALSLLFLMVTIGRFLGGFLVDRVGFLRSVLIAILAATFLVALGIFGPASMSLALPLSGLFLSIIFPTLTAAASEGHQENVGAILGVLFTFAGVGGMLGPWLIGIASDWLGIRLGFGVSIIFGLVTSLAVLILLRENDEERMPDRLMRNNTANEKR
jgi:fucose permease